MCRVKELGPGDAKPSFDSGSVAGNGNSLSSAGAGSTANSSQPSPQKSDLALLHNSNVNKILFLSFLLSVAIHQIGLNSFSAVDKGPLCWCQLKLN